MKIPNEDFENLSRNSKNQKGLFQLLEEKSENIVKKQYNQNELFFTEHYLKDYVNNLKKQTIIGLDEEIKNNLFVKPKRKSKEIDNSKIIRKNRKKLTTIKNDKVVNFKIRRLSSNINSRMRLENINYESIKSKKKPNLKKEENKKKNENNILIHNKDHNKPISHRKSAEIIKSISKNKSSNILSKRYLLEKSILDEEINLKRHSFINKNNLTMFKKPTVFNGENDSKSIIYDNGKKNNIIKTTHLNNKEIVQLNEIKNEMKNTIIGKSTIIELDASKFFLIDENGEIKEKKLDEKEIEKYRILTRKGYVYDSFDDEENLDEMKNFNYIHPNSIILKILDFFVFIFTFYNLFYIPFFLAKNDVYCMHNVELILFINFIDIIFIIDVIISFFVAYYNFDEVLIVEYRKMFQHYLETWFFIDFIAAIPFQTIFTIFNNKCRDDSYLFQPFNKKEFYYLFILLRLLKIFKIISKNRFLNRILRVLAKLRYINGRVLINIFAFFLSLHIVACIFIFIGKNDYPNWIVNFNHNNKSFKKLYLIAIYYTITTLTTVGYGDISCISSNEKIFGLFMEVIGICAYSWALTEISNYIKVLNEKNEELSNKIQILDDIKLNYPRLPNELYDRIIRYLRYQHYYEKKDKNIIIEELPIGLRNNLIYEMYKPVINNFTFFKDFSNIDFIVKVIVAFKPILSLKNDILIKDGDLVEDIIFVKRGRLSLEIPFHLIKPKKGKAVVKRNSTASIRRSTLFFNNITRENSVNNNIYCFSPTNNNQTLKNNFSFLNNTTNKNNTIKDKEEEENMQYYKILEIRRNEHFGDILMFLNQRSPLYLRVKSKKAELFFLNKQDAINISTSYPQYWKKINQKSLFNMQQIKRLINKIIKIISTEHVINPGRKYSKSNDDYGHLKSIYEDDLQTIPSFSQESDYTENDNENESVNQYENNDNNEYENYYESINNLNKDKSNEINQNDDVLKTILEDNIKEIQSSNEDNSLLSEEKKEKEKTLNLDSIINYSKINSTYKIKSFKSSTTPYKYDEINNEIYPEETFKISPQSNPNYQFTTYNHLKKTYLDNNSICSTEISFSINSEYENIDELSEGNYSKDISFRTTIKNFIQEEVKRKNNCNINPISYEENDNNNNTNINIKNNNDINIKKKGSYIPRRSSNFSLNHINKSKTRNNILKMKSKDFKNKNPLKEDLNEKEDENKKNKNYMLSVISQNIEKDNLNLNNPELFYSEVFMKFMDRKMTKIKENNPNTEINKEDKDFIRRVTSISTMKYEFNKNYLSLKNKI